MNDISFVLRLGELGVIYFIIICILEDMYIRDFVYEMLISWVLDLYLWLFIKYKYFDVLFSFKLYVKNRKCVGFLIGIIL